MINTILTGLKDSIIGISERYLSIQDYNGMALRVRTNSWEEAASPASKGSSVLYVIDLEKKLMYSIKEMNDCWNPTEDDSSEIPEDCLGFYLSYDDMEFADFETEEEIAEFRKKYGDDPILTVNFIYSEDFGKDSELSLAKADISSEYYFFL